MTAGDAQFAEWAAAETEPPRRRRGWGWLVAVVVVGVLVVAAWFLGEWIARDFITKAVREQVVTRLALPADQQVDVELAGAVIPQLISGTFDDVTIASDDVPLGDSLTGDVIVHATGVNYRDVTAASATAQVTLDTAQVRTLLTGVDGFPADTVGLADPDVTISTALSLFGASFPVAVALTPSTASGALVLSPDSLQLGGAEITADALRSRFGALADTVLRDWTICIADDLPRGVTLSDVAVQGDRVVADVVIDPAIVTEASLRAKGTCT